MSILRFLLCAVVLFILSPVVRGDDTVRIWVKAFIPGTHPTNPGFTKPIPNKPGKTMVVAKVPISGAELGWFATDHRTFSADPDASARQFTDITLIVGTSAASVKGTNGAAHKTSPTEKIDPTNGNVESKRATLATDALSKAFFADGKVQVVFQAASSNPFLPSPNVDYALDCLFDTRTKNLTVKGSVGAFPAFEVYASLNGGPSKTIIRYQPVGRTAWSLLEFGTGVNGQKVDATISLR